jgi:hypothetical protein
VPRSSTGSRRGEKKAQARLDTAFLDWALTDFSGDVAADALSDGPFCMLSAVDHRCDKRLLSAVLDHDPTHADIRAFLGRVKTALSARDLTLLGVTTDGSALSPAPLREVCGKVPQQIGALHIVAEGANAVLGAVARGPQGPGSQATHRAHRAPEHASGHAGGPHEKAADRAARRVVHLALSLRPTPPA